MKKSDFTMIVCQSGTRIRKEVSGSWLVVILLFSWLCMPGCGHRDSVMSPKGKLEEGGISQEQIRGQLLEQELTSLLGSQDEEASILAKTALTQTNYLAQKYGITGSSRWHNLLVNLGIKERGLCCHWTRDLLQTLNDFKLEKYNIYWAVSNHGSFREHSSVVVVSVQQEFKDGLVLDPWRNAGQLYWVRVKDDSYDWFPHPEYNGKALSIDCEK